MAASDATDTYLASANRGPCIDLVAPGATVVTAGLGGTQRTLTGSAMATPHVAGAAALLLAAEALTPAQVATRLADHATKGVLTGVPADTANLLLYVDSTPKTS